MPIFWTTGSRGKCLQTLSNACLSHQFVPPLFNPLKRYFLKRIKKNVLLYTVFGLQSKLMTTYSLNGYISHFKILIKNSMKWIGFFLSGVINKYITKPLLGYHSLKIILEQEKP